MYNRYIPQRDWNWVPTEGPGEGREAPGQGRPRRGPVLPPFLSGREGLSALFSSGEGQSGLARVLRALHLEDVDTGDVLLLLIVLYLMAEGDDLDLVIALGLVLIMGLGEEK